MAVETEKTMVFSSHHEHELQFIPSDKPFRCDGCKTESLGGRYRCEACNFDLHEDCTFTRHEEASHLPFFFGSCEFQFHSRPPPGRKGGKPKRYCNACGTAVDGFVYHCKKKGWDLHPRCLELGKTGGNCNPDLRLRGKVKRKCIWCGKKKLAGSFSRARGWAHVSRCGEYVFHVHCATEMLMDTWKKQSGGDGNALEEVGLARVLANRRRRCRGGGTKLLKFLKLFFKTMACFLLGEPITTTACVLAQWLGD